MVVNAVVIALAIIGSRSRESVVFAAMKPMMQMEVRMSLFLRRANSNAARFTGRSAPLRSGFLAFGLATAAIPLFAAATVAPVPVQAQDVALIRVNVSVVHQGYRASKLMGVNVKNDKGDTIGEIDDFVIDKKRVLYAILQVGGFLGIGAHLVAVPYESLTLNDTGTEVTLPGATKEELKSLEEFHYR
jgi:sporulation protein YlmC with PRC-barrel domain